MISLGIISFVVSVLGAFLAIRFASTIGILDIPNHRSSHTGTIPKGGGIGILLVAILAGFFLAVPSYVIFPAVGISIMSMWGGDKHCLSVKTRLIMQFFFSFGFLLSYVYGTSFAGAFLFVIPASVFIVGTSNFYNFMDGIDGIAGITGVVGFSLLAYYNHSIGGNSLYSQYCVAISVSCIGFLCFNFPKAKVFLGDLGSILLGFLFGTLVIVMAKTPADILVMIGFLSLFYMDELFTMIVRLRQGEPLIIAHRKHIYQLLANELKIQHWKISLFYGGAQMIIGLSLIWTRSLGIGVIVMQMLLYAGLFTTVSVFIHRKVSQR